MQLNLNLKTLTTNFYYNLIAAILISISLGLIDWYSGYELSFQFFYFIPLALVSLYEKQNRITLILWAVLIALIWFLADFHSGHRYSGFMIPVWNTISRFIVFVFFVFFLNTIVKNRVHLNSVNQQLSNKNKIISESIDYAKTIQNSIIPDYRKFSGFFKDSFILSQPKDVLSGDFFWSYINDDKIILALVDCTGHGIPGALLSVIGVIMLNKIVNEKGMESPAEILQYVTKEIVALFSAGNDKVDDGMEMSIVAYNRKTNELIVSQSSNSIAIVDADNEITMFKPDDYLIGANNPGSEDSLFSNYSYKIEGETMLYLFTDGYTDQFGFEQNRKFGIQQFYKKIREISKLACNKQLQLLNEEHMKWKGNLRSTDDVTVVGIRL